MSSDHLSHLPDTPPSFDDAARAAHAISLDRLSPQVQAQLAQRRRTALSSAARPPASRGWPMLALGSAATLAVAIGLFALHGNDSISVRPASDTVASAPASDASVTAAGTANTGSMPDAVIAAPPTATASTAPEIANSNTPLPAPVIIAAEFASTDAVIGFAAAEESPDFYLWLGSQDAQSNVTEFL